MRIQIKLSVVLTLLAMYVSILEVYPQLSFPEGVYFSHEEVVTRTPSLNHQNIVVTERTMGDMVLMGGNDYKIECEAVPKREIRKVWYAYSDGEALYINCFPFGLQNFYAKALTKGYYTLINVALPQDEAAATALMFGFIGSAVTANKRHPYIIENGSGNISLLTEAKMQSILAIDQKLLDSYKDEPTIDDNKLIEYVQAVNDKFEAKLAEQSTRDEMDPNSYPKLVDLIVYRMGRKQSEQAVLLSITDSVVEEFVPNSFKRLKLIYQSVPIKVCDTVSTNCILVDFSETSTQYVSCSLSEKETEVILKIEDQTTGEWDSDLAKRNHDKRIRKDERERKKHP